MVLNNNTWWIYLLLCFTFIACDGESESLDPDASGDSDLVEVKLAFSTGDTGNANTRMTAENTQGNNIGNENTYTYRGISQANLVPFSSTSTSDSPIDENSIRLQINNVYAGYTLSYQNTDNRQENRVYTTTLVPSHTNSFLVYAWPDGGGVNATSADKFTYGSLVSTGLDEDAGITNRATGIAFKPDKVWDDDNGSSYTDYYNMAKEVANYLTRVANSTVDGEPLYRQKGNVGNLFSALSHDGLPFSYGRMYIQQKLQNLNNYFKNYLGSQTVTSNIHDNSNYNRNSYNKLNNDGAWSPLSNLQVYPYGTFLFKWEEGEEKFVVLERDVSKAVINPSIADYQLYSYPAQLWYYTNTSIHTSTEDLQNSVFDKSWDDVLNDSRFNANGSISSHTKVVAVDKQLTYAVGRMETMIHIGSTNSSLPGLSNINLLQLKGVMVTNQYKAGYDFQALETDNTESADEPYYMIYDRDVKTTNANGEITPITPPGKNKWSAANHTLVLPSKAGEKVYVIVEMFYNGSYKVGSESSNAPSLSGYKGYPILPQSYFYMVGVLDPGTAKAFESGKVATVKATINSLEGAYNYVPDLNSPALVLGLKIDLNWQQAEPKSVWLH